MQMPMVIGVFVVSMATASAFAQEPYDLTLPDTRFYGSSIFEITAEDDPADRREAFLAVYHSPLGSELQRRDPTSAEMAEVRRICRYLQDIGTASQAGPTDDYFIEFADGEGDPTWIAPKRRYVFGFEQEAGCDAEPIRIDVN